MKVIDITGEIREGMWNYEPPFPAFAMSPLGEVPWTGCKVSCEVFDGLHSQTGTYLETPAHYFGNKKSYLVTDIPISNLVHIPCTLLMLDPVATAGQTGRPAVTAEALQRCLGSNSINPGDAILVGTGWGQRWMESDYLTQSPWFTLEAMRWLLSKKPFLLGSDIPRWENLETPQGFFPEFYTANVLMLAPCVNLENVPGCRVHLTALPLNIPGTSAVPCRAIVEVAE